MSYQEDILTLS